VTLYKFLQDKKIPADIRVITASDDMKVEQSALTGEPDQIKKKPGNSTETNPLEASNLLFFGTLCPSGSCEGIVVNIGDNTVMGRISAITTQVDAGLSPIKQEINRFVLLVSGVAVFLGVTFFIIGAVLKTDPITNLVFMIGIIVANVPEGLLATVTVCLSLTAQRMYTKNVLVKELDSVETLGSTSCICSDKTGTLTINKMTIANVCVDQGIFQTNDGEERDASKTYEFPLVDTEDDSIKRLTRCMTNCNNAKWIDASKVCKRPNEPYKGLNVGDPVDFRHVIELGGGTKENRIMWEPSGDASESAMIKFAEEQPLSNEAAYKQAGCEVGSCPGIVVARKAYQKLECEVGAAGAKVNKKWEIKFNSKNKYQVSVHSQPGTKAALLLMKGAPERILNRCSHVWQKGERVELTQELRDVYEERNLQLAAMGRRCLAFCEQELDEEKYSSEWTGYEMDPVNYPIGNSVEEVEKHNAKGGDQMDMASTGQLTYIGLAALIDPPRKQVKPAVLKCKSAGIQVVMVTGDHPATAHAIAKEVGIIWGKTEKEIRADNKKNPKFNGEESLPVGADGYSEDTDPDFAPAIVVAGWEFDHLTAPEVWDDYLRHGQIVFARTSPQQKLIIVENFQKRGKVVAVTGDGVNDAPALKKADIGVAMGIMGSEVSKEAANMILLDDNFASIVAGVEEGRLIFDNLKKSIAYTLSSNIPEISPFLAFIVIGVPLPLSTILILCVDLGTDMVPAISMAWENKEADIMTRNPRDPDVDHLVTLKLVCFAYLQVGVIQALAGFFSWITVMNDYGYPSYVLPTLGQFDNWGKHNLMCKVEGGVLRNEAGAAYSTGSPLKTMAYDSMTLLQRQTAMAGGYMFWDIDNVDFDASPAAATTGIKVGNIINCAFPGKNYKGGATEEPAVSSWQDVFSNKVYFKTGKSSDTVDFTSQYLVPTTQSILSLHQAGYIEYLPFKSRMSPFYDNRWQHWPIEEKGSGLGIFGMGATTLNLIHYQTSPLGMMTLDPAHMKHWEGLSADASVDVRSEWNDNKDLTKFKINGVGMNQMDKAYTTVKWNLPGRDPSTAYTAATLLSATNLKDFTVFPVDANASTAHYQYQDAAGTSTTPGFTVGGTLVNRLYSWAGAQSWTTIQTKAATTKYVKKSYMNVVSRMMQREALAHAQCAGFICIIVVQWADLMICKTRWLSIREQGMVNPVMNFGLLFETILGCFLCYIPGLGDVLGTRPIRFQHWFPGMPFCLFIFFYDEMRKYLMRKTSKNTTSADTGKTLRIPGWLEKMTYY